MPSESPVLVLLNDLMFRVKVEQPLKQAGLPYRFVGSPADLTEALRQNMPQLIIVDLNLKGRDALDAIQSIRSEPGLTRLPILGYVSHVQTDVRQAALDLGCTRVIARSVLSQNLPEILSKFVTSGHLD